MSCLEVDAMGELNGTQLYDAADSAPPRNAGAFCFGLSDAHPAGPAISHRPEPIVIVSASSFLIELAYVRLPF